VEKILVEKDYKRIVTAGFLHLSWMHLLFNMLTLYFFMGIIENTLREVRFIIIYFSGLVGGHLFALYIHRNHPDYRSAGASGAICGIMFAAIALFPGFSIGLFILPFSLPGWLYGLAFILFSIHGIKTKAGNTGNEAHLGGALSGMTVALIMEPAAISQNYIRY
jgi:membrane associated rhomboid family serine protease